MTSRSSRYGCGLVVNSAPTRQPGLGPHSFFKIVMESGWSESWTRLLEDMNGEVTVMIKVKQNRETGIGSVPQLFRSGFFRGCSTCLEPHCYHIWLDRYLIRIGLERFSSPVLGTRHSENLYKTGVVWIAYRMIESLSHHTTLTSTSKISCSLICHVITNEIV
jgi:hypothetical protein